MLLQMQLVMEFQHHLHLYGILTQETGKLRRESGHPKNYNNNKTWQNVPLTGNSISTSYQGLLKTSDNGALSATEKPLVDGLANVSTIEIGTGGVSFTSGTVDFTGATVSGLPAGAAGLESGTGTGSMQSAASLTVTPADAAGLASIALGAGAESNAPRSVSIGPGAGDNQPATAENAISIGSTARAYGVKSIQIGVGESNNSGAGGEGAISIGAGDGYGVEADGDRSIAIGYGGTNAGDQNGATANDSISIGTSTKATVSGAVGLGSGVTAAIVNTVSIKALEVQTDSTPTAGGIIISDAGSTDRRINITSAGIPQIDSDPMLVNDSTTTVDMTKVWSGTEAQYTALGTYDANTLYFLT